MRSYKTKALLPMLMELKLHLESEEKSATNRKRVEAPTKRRVAFV